MGEGRGRMAMKYYQSFSLKNYNSFKLNSIANEIYFPETITELQALIKELKGVDFNILSDGTNVILNKTINRIICLRKMEKYFIPLNNNKILVSASYSTNNFVNKIIKMNFIGVEGLLGIPGRLGGGIIMNAGSGKYAISDYLLRITTININGNFCFYTKKDLQFGRRYSILQDKKEIIVEALFDFKQGIPNKKEIEKAIKHRKTLPKYPSAGGIFKNWHALKPYSNELIGLRVGDAEISSSVNIIVNKNNATFDDIMTLIKKVKNTVKNPLELEIKIIRK